MAPGSRQYELVLLGATGYTGKLTAEHIATSLPTDLKWAIAGRNEQKLSAVVEELKKKNPDRPSPDIEVCEIKKDALDALAKKAILIITTVGPFMKFGTPVVEACANNGTHYIDSTGEVPWVYDIINKYHDTAKANGAVMIPQCGVDSVPADMMAYLIATHIRRTLNAGTSEVLNVAKLKSKPSGGTLHTILSLFDHYSLSQVATSLKPFALSPVQPPASSTSPTPGLVTKILGIRQDKDLGILTDWVQAGVDTAIVQRSWGLLDGGKLYGPNFRFSEWMAASSALMGVLVHFGMAFSMLMIALPPVRFLLKKLVFQPGEGPEIESTKQDHAHYKSVGIADTPKAERAAGTIKFNGSMYYLTGLALAEAAMVILRGGETDAKKLGGGILTPATLGDEYLERLRKAGVTVEVNMM
ncbi:uncharacterized protein K452DRAFT_306694 [Aplosporella prunicola CBS 121167]|uniref:Saccharopine dehydrogenase NADP binding domain-containing protein n=1 Tax=Aplosporella prunicola CBS 121167 TaxID=1176127 RepID=A0A6A6BND3_9PEZI|nr:uncharacterized protein K452DRAFT_306694 [Aplosporella prunicola CBS 121167]KAF2144061.1 hypothetical protein K452DRAFT_306694 [Aplosporella prunicola CBS 121167]